MKKALSVALAAVMTLTLATGCKKKADIYDEQGRVKLLIGLPGGYPTTAQRVVDNFKNNTASKYAITTDEGSWGDFNKKLLLQISANDPAGVTPVFFTDSMQAATFGAQGAAMDLTDMIKEIDQGQYTNALYALQEKEDFNADGKENIWGVPHALNSIAMVYNKDIFDERGVAYPTADWTFDDMLKLAEQLTYTKADGTKVYGIDYSSNITQGWLPFMAAVGVSPYTEDFRNSNLKDPKVKEAMEKYAAPIRAGYVMPAAELSAEGGAAQAFATGKIAMALLQSSSIPGIEKAFGGETARINYDVQIMPYGWGENAKRSCVYVPNAWQIYSGAHEEVKKAAVEWLKYYLSEEGQMIVAAEGGSGFPIMQSALDSISNGNAGKVPNNIYWGAFYDGINEHGITLLENPSSAVSRKYVDTMTADIRNGKDIDACINEQYDLMTTAMNDFYADFE